MAAEALFISAGTNIHKRIDFMAETRGGKGGLGGGGDAILQVRSHWVFFPFFPFFLPPCSPSVVHPRGV